MSAVPELPDEIGDVVTALGLLSAGGGLNSNWFDTPLDKLKTILSDTGQRDALLRVLDALLPPASSPDVPANEKWHPLLGAQPRGNVYLTVHQDADGVLLGAAGHFGSPPVAGNITAQLIANLPLVRAGAGVDAVAGTANGPLRVTLRVNIGWGRPAEPIGLKAMVFAARITTSGVEFTLTLEQLQTDVGAPRDVVLDPSNLGKETLQLLLGLVKRLLHDVAAVAGAEANSLKNHLLPLLGLADDGIPAFPLGDLANPAALQQWLGQMLDEHGPPPIVPWLEHLAGLLGGPGGATQGSGTASDPWRVVIVPFAAGEGLAVTLYKTNGGLGFGVLATVMPGAAGDPRIQASATISEIPLGGVGRAKVLPAAAVTLNAPGNGGNLVNTAAFAADALSAGVIWDGTSLGPRLELIDVRLDGTTYPKIDLTNTDSVAQAASAAVRAALDSALGNGVGRHLAALTGLIAPANDATSPLRVDAAQLFGDPAQAIGRFHRSVLLDAAHNWSFMLQEVAALLGLGGAIGGTGVAADPWRVNIATAGALELSLTGWNAASAGNPGDPQQLRLGLMGAVGAGTISAHWLAELLAFDLPASGTSHVGLLAGQHLAVRVAPGPHYETPEGLEFAADAIEARMDWTPGGSIEWRAGVTQLRLTADGSTINVPALGFPATFDVANPVATAASLGISIADLEALLKHLIGRAAASWGELPGFVLAALLGVHGRLNGLQNDWPTLTDPGAAGSLIADPGGAIRAWLDRVATQTSGDGTAFLTPALPWLKAVLDGRIDETIGADFAGLPKVAGDGTYESPWLLPLDSGTRAVHGLAWLEPAGPPSNWAAALSGAAAGAVDLAAVAGPLRGVASFQPAVANAISGFSDDTVIGSLDQLARHFADSDGVVPFASQTPTGGTWTSGTPIGAAHHRQPQDASAITQIHAQLGVLAGGAAGARCVLYLGPAFADKSAWNDLLASPARHGTTDPAANFALRQPGVDPLTISLESVTATVDHYTAELADDGSGDVVKVVAQIAHIVARLNALRPGMKVTLVAHSTAGLAARAYTAANTAKVQGLITLGTPHLGAPLPFLTDATVAQAVRMVQGLRGGIPASPLRDAFEHLWVALDGYSPPATPGALPVAVPYPVDSFVGTPSIDTGGVPALALGGRVAGNLLDLIKSSVAGLATTAAAAARPTPTHLGFGVSAALDMGTAQAGQIVVDARLRANLFRIKLRNGVAEPARPSQAMQVAIALERPGGWLVGGPAAYAGSGNPPQDARIRRAELGAAVDRGGDDTLRVKPYLNFTQCGFRGSLADAAGLAEAIAKPLLGALMQRLSVPASPSGSPAAALIGALNALGLALPDPARGFGFSADALDALQADAVAFIAPRLTAALQAPSGLAGLRRAADGSWRLPVPDLPVEIYILASPWRLGLRTIPADTGALALGGEATLGVDGTVAFPAMTSTLSTRLAIGVLSLEFAHPGGELRLAAPPWLKPVRLFPAPTPGELAGVLNDVLPRVIFSSAANTLIEALLGPDVRVGPLDSFFSDTAGFLQRPESAGSSSGGFDGAKINTLLTEIGKTAGLPPGPGLTLPASLRLTASGAGTDASPLSLQLATTAPLAGVLTLALSATVDRLRHFTPSGSVSLATPLTGGWPHVSIDFQILPAGVALAVTPQGQPPIQILPSFSGLGALRGAAEALLPKALDALVQALSTPGPAPAWLTRILSVAEALALYDPAGKFAAHANDLHALIQGNLAALTDSTHRSNAANALVTLLNGLGLPGSVSNTAATVNWSFPVGGGRVGIAAGWDGGGPLARVFASDLQPAGAPVHLNLNAGYAAGSVIAALDARLSLASAVGVAVTPALGVGIDTGGGFSVKLHPLATSGATPADGPLEIVIAPTSALNLSAGAPEQIIAEWALPLAVQSAFAAAKPRLGDRLWSTGPTLRDALDFAHVIDKATDTLKHPLPDLLQAVSGLAAGVAANAGMARADITPNLHVALKAEGPQIGIALSGQQDFDAGDFKLSMRFGAPSNWSPSGTNKGKADDGLVAFLFDTSSGIALKPELLAAGLGFGLSGRDGPLVNTSYLRIGGFLGYLFFDLQTVPSLSVTSLGGGLDLKEFGIPLGLATSGNVGGNNPVAASLLRSDGGGAGHPGDTQPVNPAADVEVWYWSAPKGDDKINVRVGGETGALWIGVHQGFGPIYIDQVGVTADDDRAALLIDGGVSVAGFTAQVDDLTVDVPYRHFGDPTKWSLDLKGLAVGYSNPAVSIAGGLVKFDGPPIEYDGMLLIKVSQIGIVAVGSYSTPLVEGSSDTYTSVAIFAGVFVPIGIPPIIKISALGLGVGYNRQILVPDDLNRIPNFALVKALDRPEDFANNPMGTLMDFRAQFPARRGSFWIAVGLRGTSFEVVNVTAVLYVALDRGLEVGLLGVARMALPADDAAIVSVELALKVRFSTAEGLFSIQAQLTDNSWLLSPDCQLTGGFAYFMWFRESQFLLTLGGYNPAFQPRPEFPVVPRLGYHWNFLGVVHIKGESYFALTSTCVMAGTRMEATYGPDWLQVWFTAYADVLVSWDPFYYDLTIGISVGARLRIEVCFIACAHITISVSVGASLRLQGPPLHGTVTADLGVTTVMFPFGPEPRQDKSPLPWPAFRDKYLLNSDPASNAFQAHVIEGLLPPDPPGGEIAPGKPDAPWKIAPEWAFQTGTNMAAKGFAFQTNDPRVEGDLGTNPIGRFDRLSAVYDFGIAPVGKEPGQISSLHRVVVQKWNAATQTASDVTFEPGTIGIDPIIAQVSEATWHYFGNDEPPAAANTLPALTGLNITGTAASRNPSKAIDIRNLRDESNSRPLPFATLDVATIGQLIAAGTAAVGIAKLAEGASSTRITQAAGEMLGNKIEFFRAKREGVGLPPAGLDPIASRQLATRRSAPPLVVPLSNGLTLESVRQPLPPVIDKVPQAAIVALESPRLRAVMTAQHVPTKAAGVNLRTTVSRVAGARATRGRAAAAPPRIARVTVPPPSSLVGSGLSFVPRAGAARPTSLAAAGRTLLSTESGFTVGRAHQAGFAEAERALGGKGVAVPAGVTHLWDVPPGARRVVVLDGTAASRLTMLSGAGHVIDDSEFAATNGRQVVLPDACAMLAVSCLGELPAPGSGAAAMRDGTMGAVSLVFARAGTRPIVGWQSSNEVQQVGQRTYLARGAAIEIAAAGPAFKRGQRAIQGVVTLAAVLPDQQAVETLLPSAVSALGILLDVQDACADDVGDLAVAVDGKRLGAAPLVALGGRRKVLLYDLAPDDTAPKQQQFGITVASRSGLRLAGVLGMAGTAQEWAVRMNGQVPPNLVLDGPLVPHGEVRVRLAVSAPLSGPTPGNRRS